MKFYTKQHQSYRGIDLHDREEVRVHALKQERPWHTEISIAIPRLP